MPAKGKYSAELVEQITRFIEAGNYAVDACLAVGISNDTYYEWLKTKPEFSDTIKKARAKAIAKKVIRIDKAGQEGNWQADAWWLERVARKRFGRDEPQVQQQTNIVLGYEPKSPFIESNAEKPKHLNVAQLHSRKIGEMMGKKAVNEGRKRQSIRPRKKR